jgi:hypothetical protein
MAACDRPGGTLGKCRHDPGLTEGNTIRGSPGTVEGIMRREQTQSLLSLKFFSHNALDL